MFIASILHNLNHIQLEIITTYLKESPEESKVRGEGEEYENRRQAIAPVVYLLSH